MTRIAPLVLAALCMATSAQGQGIVHRPQHEWRTDPAFVIVRALKLKTLQTRFSFARAWNNLFQTVPGCTVTVANSYTPIQDAITAAAEGDVICVQAGTLQFDNFLSVGTKCVTIRGAGVFSREQGSAGQTIWHTNNTSAIIGLSESNVCPPTIENIRFTNTEGVNPNTLYGLITVNYGVGSYQVIVRYCDFYFTGSGNESTRALMFSTRSGLIYRNHFTYTFTGASRTNTNVQVFNHSVGGDSVAWWDRDTTKGTLDNTGLNKVYFETNLVEALSLTADLSTSARSLLRFNTFDSSALFSHGYDSSVTGVFEGEIYENTWLCTKQIQLSNGLASTRGGQYYIFNNTFPTFNVATCGYPENADAKIPILFSIYKIIQCVGIGGLPGTYPDIYPTPHQTGWTFKTGSNVRIGAAFSDPAAPNGSGGLAGFLQALMPMRVWGNANSAVASELTYVSNQDGECRAMVWTTTAKGGAAATTTQVVGYASSGQHLNVYFTSLIGGTAPVSTSPDETWTALTPAVCSSGGTVIACAGAVEGDLRLDIWRAPVTVSGTKTITITHPSTTAARVVALTGHRGYNNATPDKAIAIIADNASPYVSDPSGVLTQTSNQVCGYVAMNGPTTYPQTGQDQIAVSAPDTVAIGGPILGKVGIIGTTGGTAASNVSLGIGCRATTATDSITSTFTNTTANRFGLIGLFAYKLSGAASVLDNNVRDFFVENREYYDDDQTTEWDCNAAPAACAKGIGSGTRAQRPTTATAGVAWWSTNQGGD